MEESTFNIVYKKNFRPLCMYAFSFVKNYEDAENIVQDAFVKLWFKEMPESQCVFFLWRLTKNDCINFNRHIKAVRKHSPNIGRFTESISNLNDDEQELVLLNFISTVLDNINEMPGERRRIAFYLRYFKDKSGKEIGYLMGNSNKTIKEHLSKALTWMRMKFGSDFKFRKKYIK